MDMENNTTLALEHANFTIVLYFTWQFTKRKTTPPQIQNKYSMFWR